MIAAALERQGYTVEQAGDGREALEALETNTFNLVLTDIVMQDVNGIALLERIHALQPNLPVVMVTAVHDISVAIDSMRRGAYDYLLKPFEREQLLATVERALNHRQALEETQNYHQSLEKMVRARTEMLRHAMEDLEHSYDVTLEALGDALDLKDSETEGHSKRVTAYAIALARAMGIPPEEIKIIARGAFLHDIGKMAIPDEILRKPGKLTPEEQELMREHCARGYHMLRKIPFLAGAAEIVFCHQEHFDGTRLPQPASPAARFPSARASSPWPTPSTPSPATVPTARLAASTPRAKRSCAARARSSTPPSSRSSSRFPTSSGRSCAPRSAASTCASPPSTWPGRRLPRRQRGTAPLQSPRGANSMPILSLEVAQTRLARLPGWQIESGELVRTVQLADFRAALAFVNRVGELAEQAGHHPDIDIRYSRVRLVLVTHSAGGLTEKDFDLAGEIQKMAG